MSTPKMEVAGAALPVSNSTGILLGASAALDLSEDWAVEFGMNYTKRKFSYDLATVHTEASLPTLEITGVLKYYMIPFINVNGGFYTGAAVGEATVGSTTASFSSLGLESSDFGMILGTGLRLPSSFVSAFTLDLNFLFGLKDLDSSAGSLKMRDIQILAGIQIGL